MGLRTLLRVSTAPRAAIVLLPWLFLYSGNVREWIVTGYWESATAQSSFLLGFIAPACAACAAWEGARIRSAGVLHGSPVRSPATVAVSSLLPVLALGVLSVLLALVLVAPVAWGSTGTPALRMIGLQVLVVAAHTGAGYGAGLLLPPLVALPIALAGSFLWMAYPATLPTFWVRQLNGHNLGECCALDQVIAPRALAAPALVAVGVLAGSLVVVLARRRAWRLFAPVPVAVTVIVGAQLAAPLGYAAARDRDPAALDCVEDRLVVCLWPEQRAGSAQIRAWSADAGERLRAAGVRPDLAVTFSSVEPSENEVRLAIAGSVLADSFPACAESEPWSGGEALGPLHAWLAITAGLPPEHGLAGLTEEESRLAAAVRELPGEAQSAWFDANHHALAGCAEPPPLDPAAFTAAATGRVSS